MVVIGVDPHKATHTLVGTDAAGRKLGELTVPATTDGHLKALTWARREFGVDVVWGVEDCRSVTLRLERDFLDAGQRVVRVPPHLMARVRASARTRGKSDPIDALAVARAVLREPDLPVACHDEASRELKLLVDRRDHLVTFRVAVTNRLLWRMHELDPVHAPKAGTLHTHKAQEQLRGWLITQPGLIAELALAELTDLTALTGQINALHRRIRARIEATHSSLLNLRGCAALTAAKLIGETAQVSRFRSEAAFARHAGVAPTPHSSGGKTVRHSGSRSGNRQLSTALYRIAMIQIQHDGPSEAYYRKRREGGDSHAQALRRVQRRLARKVFHCLRADYLLRTTPPGDAAPGELSPGPHGATINAHDAPHRVRRTGQSGAAAGSVALDSVLAGENRSVTTGRRTPRHRLGRPKALDPARVARAQRMHTSGHTAAAIAATLGVSPSTIYRALKAGPPS